MIIVYGTKHSLKKDKDLQPAICPNCGVMTQRGLCREKTKFHIFYIPLIVYTARRGVVCPKCGMYKELNASEYKEICKNN